MSPRIYVDCDDTLVKWRVNSASSGVFVTDGYNLNHRLILSIKSFLLVHRDYDLVVWSGGGVGYASRWAEMSFPSTPYLVIAKDVRNVPGDRDVVVDDMAAEMRPRDSRAVVVSDEEMEHCPLCYPEDCVSVRSDDGDNQDDAGADSDAGDTRTYSTDSNTYFDPSSQ